MARPGGMWLPRATKDYPFDFDGSLRYTRPRTGTDYTPTGAPPCGMVSGFMPQLDAFVWAQAYGKNAYGPGTMPVFNLGYQAMIQGLNKYTAQPGA